MGSGAAFLQIADNAMNYHILGGHGFAAVGRMVDHCRSFNFEYSRLDDAIAVFGIVVAGTMWMIRRWHLRNGVVHRAEMERLLAIARSDRH